MVYAFFMKSGEECLLYNRPWNVYTNIIIVCMQNVIFSQTVLLQNPTKRRYFHV